MLFRTHSLTGRVFVGEMAGFVFGLIFMFLMPAFGVDMFSMYSWGVLLMLVVMGAMIGFIGIFERHPVLGMPLPWWVRGPAVGAMFMLILVLLNFDAVYTMMLSPIVSWMGFESPFWIMLDGVVIGGIIGLICTKLSGEGSTLPIK